MWVWREGLRGWPRSVSGELPLIPLSHRAAVCRGRTPAWKLLFIHRLCLLKSLPCGPCLPPTPSPAFHLEAPCALQPQSRPWVTRPGRRGPQPWSGVRGDPAAFVGGSCCPLFRDLGTPPPHPPAMRAPTQGVVWKAGCGLEGGAGRDMGVPASPSAVPAGGWEGCLA